MEQSNYSFVRTTQMVGHKEENYATFAEKYRSELDNNPEAMPFANHIKALLESSNVTLLYGAKKRKLQPCYHS